MNLLEVPRALSLRAVPSCDNAQVARVFVHLYVQSEGSTSVGVADHFSSRRSRISCSAPTPGRFGIPARPPRLQYGDASESIRQDFHRPIRSPRQIEDASCIQTPFVLQSYQIV